ncbi:protein tyrosine phosphatase type IVA 1-like [Apodemus sylvaticus]|uniref:protein tyrosine phosphatase type IVA 1-like n=1 Tax=Apodemus sylvaticus TaxID=10129 RepID=UPI00224305EB|nr:protein tyrosine phosphatase type IVA 1-like [Apodemus sylvaticus]
MEVTYRNMRFLITYISNNVTLNKFIEDWPFDDGVPPLNQIVDDWLSLVKIKLREEPGCCIAVYCVTGFGIALVLVALALIQGGMKYEDVVQFIKQKWQGAFDSKQLLYLEKY